MGKGSNRRPEDRAAIERNWPFPPVAKAGAEPFEDYTEVDAALRRALAKDADPAARMR